MFQSAASGGFYGGLMGLGMGATFGAAQHIYKAFTTPKPPTIESQRLSGTTLTPTKAGIPVNSNSKAPEVKPVVETPAHPQTNTGNTGGGFHQPSTEGVSITRELTPRIIVDRSPSVWRHIFRNSNGHVNPSTATSQNRYASLFEKVANNSMNLRTDAVQVGLIDIRAVNTGTSVFTQTFKNGSQVWVWVRNSKIVNAGININPR